VRRVIGKLRVDPGTKPRIANRDTADKLGFAGKPAGEKRLQHLHGRLSELHDRLYAEGRHSVLLVLQGLDASGKDGVIRSVFTGLNPQGCRVVSFKAPAPNELAHDYLWRVHANLPARGEIGIFNRSHYEDVVAVRMLSLAPPKVWKRRPAHIRDWERMLTDEGTTLVKVFLNVSKEEQRRRFQARLDDPVKRWKFRRDDLKVRERFDDYVAAWEDVLAQTSTEWAPWYVVPADHNWVKAVAVAELLMAALDGIDPQVPGVEPGDEGLRIT
jgi:PPK2 family polyphosphate:nucleotide phosphotransferase